MRRSPNESNWTELGRATRLSRIRPKPPRGGTYNSTTNTLSWEPPADRNNITHYRIYADSESSLLLEMPAGQRQVSGLPAMNRAFISSINSVSRLESSKALVPGPIGPSVADTVYSATETITGDVTDYAGPTTSILQDMVFYLTLVIGGSGEYTITWDATYFDAATPTNIPDTVGAVVKITFVGGSDNLWHVHTWQSF